MPYKRRYARKPRRKRRRRKEAHTSVKKAYRIAKKVATQVLMRNTTANWTQTQIGAYAPATGQWSSMFGLNPGPQAGMFVAFPSIGQSAANPGKIATRIDRKVILKGIRVRLRFQVPPNVQTSFLNVYLVKALDGSVLPSNFNCPDAVSMLRNDSALVADLNKFKILKTTKIVINAKGPTTVSVKDLDYYYRFSKGEILEYDGGNPNDWLNKQFILAIKASYQVAAIPLSISVYGTITTYFRDLM